MKSFLLAIVFASTLVFPGFAGAQTFAELRRSTAERDLETLLEAIGTYDNGNIELVQAGGMQASGSETHSVTLQIISDPRVRKIFVLLKAMPQAEAASIVRKSYQKNLALLEKTTLKGKRVPMGMVYGVHAKLWLSYQFDTLDNFNRNFNDWNHWYVESLVNQKYVNKGSNVPGPIRKMSFASLASPELMLYLNIVLNEKSKTGEIGDDSDLAMALKAAGLSPQLSTFYTHLKVMPFEAETEQRDSQDIEPLLEIPVFPSWAGLDSLDIEKRAALISDIGGLIEKKGPLLTSAKTMTESILLLGGNVDVEALNRAKAKANRTGTLIEFFGSDRGKRLARGWYAERPPTKQQLMKAVDRILRDTPPSERSEWKACIAELREWVVEIPESGIEVSKKRTLEWPKRDVQHEDKDAEAADPDELPQLRIRLELIKTKAFMGELEDERAPNNSPESTDLGNG